MSSCALQRTTTFNVSELMLTWTTSLTNWLRLVLIIIVVPYSYQVDVLTEICASPQGGVYGSLGVIHCNFPSFLAVYWYDEHNEDEPLLRLESDYTIGRGISSGEYDIFYNGSLIINHVSHQNQMVYTVLILNDDYQSLKIQVEFLVDYCPLNQSGSIGEEVTVLCAFDPGFHGVYWFFKSDDNEPLIRLEGGLRIGRGYDDDEYDITDQGSLIIRRVTQCSDITFKVIVVDANYDTSTYYVTFKPSTICNCLQSPTNGRVDQSKYHAIYYCNEGYHLQGESPLHCKYNNITSYSWNRELPVCIPELSGSTIKATTKATASSTSSTATLKTSTLIKTPMLSVHLPVGGEPTLSNDGNNLLGSPTGDSDYEERPNQINPKPVAEPIRGSQISIKPSLVVFVMTGLYALMTIA